MPPTGVKRANSKGTGVPNNVIDECVFMLTYISGVKVYFTAFF